MLRKNNNYNFRTKGRWQILPTLPLVALLLVICATLCPPSAMGHEAHAEEMAGIKAALVPSLTISMGDTISKSITPKADGTFENLATVARVQISNCDQYNLSIHGNPNLAGTGANTRTIVPVTDNTTSANFANNTWGYNLSQNAAGSSAAVEATASTAYSAVPATSTQLVHKDNLVDYNADDYYTLNFGAKVDTTLPADTYTSTVTLSVVASPLAVITYTLNYDGNGNTSGEAPASQTGNSRDGSYEFTVAGAGTLARDGYRFLGWSESNTATTAQYTEGSKLTLTDPATSKALYAVWEKATGYSLTYNGNGNTGGSAPATQNYNGYEDSHNFTIASAGNLTKSGYTFQGWAETASATTAQYAAGSTITLNKTTPTKTLYAVWKAATTMTTYSVSYGHYVSEGTLPDKQEAQSSADTYTFTAPARPSGMSPDCSSCCRTSFRGWSTSAGGSLIYKAGDTITLTKGSPNITLYPVWGGAVVC